jgi:hypothetical protein
MPGDDPKHRDGIVRKGVVFAKSVNRACHLMSASLQKQPVPRNRKGRLALVPASAEPAISSSFSSTRSSRAVGLQRRYDKLASNYFAFVQLASIRLWLGGNVSTR